jgi:hypothetical protein
LRTAPTHKQDACASEPTRQMRTLAAGM